MNDKERERMKLGNQLCFPLYAAARSVTGLYAPLLTPLGLTYTQYLVLLVLWEKDGVPVSHIGERLLLDNGTLSPLLKKMEREGYVERKRDRRDERIAMILLTRKGKALQEKAKNIPQKAAGCIALSPDKARKLYALLYEVLKNEGEKAK